MVDGWWTGGRGRGRAEKRLFNGRISEIVRTYICWQIYESAFLLKWGKLLRRRGCCCCCPWLWGCNGAGERGNTLLVAAGVLLLLLLMVCCCCCCCWCAAAGGVLLLLVCCCCCWWWVPGEGGGETYALHPSRSRSCAFACSWFFYPANSPPFATLQPPQTHLPVPKTSLTLSFSSSIGPNSLRSSPSRLRSRLFPFSASVSHRCNFPVGDLCDIKVCVVYLTAAPPSAALIYRNICRTILPCRYSHGMGGGGEGAQPGVFYSSAYSLGNHPTSSTRNLWLMILFLIFETRNFLITRILEFMSVFLFVYIAQSV